MIMMLLTEALTAKYWMKRNGEIISVKTSDPHFLVARAYDYDDDSEAIKDGWIRINIYYGDINIQLNSSATRCGSDLVDFVLEISRKYKYYHFSIVVDDHKKRYSGAYDLEGFLEKFESLREEYVY